LPEIESELDTWTDTDSDSVEDERVPPMFLSTRQKRALVQATALKQSGRKRSLLDVTGSDPLSVVVTGMSGCGKSRVINTLLATTYPFVGTTYTTDKVDATPKTAVNFLSPEGTGTDITTQHPVVFDFGPMFTLTVITFSLWEIQHRILNEKDLVLRKQLIQTLTIAPREDHYVDLHGGRTHRCLRVYDAKTEEYIETMMAKSDCTRNEIIDMLIMPVHSEGTADDTKKDGDISLTFTKEALDVYQELVYANVCHPNMTLEEQRLIVRDSLASLVYNPQKVYPKEQADVRHWMGLLAIQSIIVTAPCEILYHNIQLVDTPAIGQTNVLRYRDTKNVLDGADVVLVVLTDKMLSSSGMTPAMQGLLTRTLQCNTPIWTVWHKEQDKQQLSPLDPSLYRQGFKSCVNQVKEDTMEVLAQLSHGKYSNKTKSFGYMWPRTLLDLVARRRNKTANINEVELFDCGLIQVMGALLKEANSMTKHTNQYKDGESEETEFAYGLDLIDGINFNKKQKQ